MAVSKLIGRQRQARKAGWTKPFTRNDDEALLKGCKFDLGKGTKPIDWIESFCRLPSGPKAGQRVELLPWFRDDLVIPFYGWILPNGLRRYRKSLTSVAKKNTKSTACSSLALYGLAGDDEEKGRYIYLAAVDKKQTKQVFHPAMEMVKASPSLSKLLTIVESRLEIRCGSNNWITSLAADQDSAQGVDAYMLIDDEKHAWNKPRARKFDAALKYAQRARKQPIYICISTRGEEESSLYGEEERYAMKVANDEIIDIEMLPLIYAPEKDAKIDDPETWKKANPGIGYSIDLETIEKEYQRAINGSPSDLVDFKRYILNMWQAGEASYLSAIDWKACELKPFVLPRKTEVCFGGVDLSSKEDICSVGWAWKFENRVYVKTRMWVPEAKMLELLKVKDSSYRNWVDNGDLFLCPGSVIDQDMVLDQIEKDIAEFRPKQLAFDRFNADQMMRKLEKKRKDFVVQIPQTFSSVSEPMKHLKLLTETGQLVHDGNECLAWQAANLCKFEDHMGNVRYVRKGKSGKYYKIDGMVSLILAISRMMYLVVAKSVYSSQDTADPLKITSSKTG